MCRYEINHKASLCDGFVLVRESNLLAKKLLHVHLGCDIQQIFHYMPSALVVVVCHGQRVRERDAT
jgi:hypothetical protein